MTVTLLDRAEMAESADLRRRLRQALAQHAAEVAADPDATPAARHLAAQVTADPSQWAKTFAIGVANNPNSGTGRADDPTGDGPDNDQALAWVIGEMWPAYAPQWGDGQ